MPVLPPRTRDPEAVRHSVLDAALQLFAHQGFADTSLRDISRSSGVSHPLILHHFGSKDGLYRAVKQRVVEGYIHRFPAVASEAGQPLQLRAELQRMMTYIGENELALKLCARTRVDDDFEAWPGEPAIFELVQARIQVSQQLGLIRGDLDARLCSIMLVGIILFWLENHRYFAQTPGGANNEAYLENAVQLLGAGLCPQTASPHSGVSPNQNASSSSIPAPPAHESPEVQAG